jgi:release factor glutamine methyltransferase
MFLYSHEYINSNTLSYHNPMNSLKKTTTTYNRLFHYNHLSIELHPWVYDPAEDSFLLLESIQVTSNDMVLELGTGCGLIALACAQQGAHVICTDINPYAVELTTKNIQQNRHLLKGPIEVRQGNLFSAVQRNERFDIILFNPPYLPTKPNDRTNEWLDIATDGGPTGLHLTQRYLRGLHRHLQPNGCAFFIFSSLSNRSLLEHYLQTARLAHRIVTTHRYEGEDLDVYRVTPTG